MVQEGTEQSVEERLSDSELVRWTSLSLSVCVTVGLYTKRTVTAWCVIAARDEMEPGVSPYTGRLIFYIRRRSEFLDDSMSLITGKQTGNRVRDSIFMCSRSSF